MIMPSSSSNASAALRKRVSARQAAPGSADRRLKKAVAFIEVLERRTLLSATLNFGTPTPVTLGSHEGQFGALIADINGDGVPDLVTANKDGTVSVAIGNGDGTFQYAEYANDSLPDGGGDGLNQSMAVADVNGNAVIVVSRPSLGNVDVLQLDQSGVLQGSDPHTVTTGLSRTINAITIADIGGDSFLVTANQDGSVSVSEFDGPQGGTTGGYYGFGATTNQYNVITYSSSPVKTAQLVSIATGDFINGGDGEDLVVVGSNGVAELIPGEAGGFNFAAAVPISQAGTDVASVTTATLTDSGFNDLLVATTTGTIIPLLGGNPGGNDANTFTAKATIDPGVSPLTTPAEISVSDFNGDGNQDFTVTEGGNVDYYTSIFLGNGDGTFQSPVDSPIADAKYTVSGDLNGDGLSDIVGSYDSANSLYVALNQTAVAAQFTSGPAANINVGEPTSLTITTSGFPSPVITESGALPKGLKFVSNGNGTASIVGIPATNTKSTFVLNLTAKNSSGAAATQALTLNVRQAPNITSSSTAKFTLNVAGSFTIKTTGGLPSTTIAATGLPAGLTLTDFTNGTAIISGTPTQSGAFTDATGLPVVITATSGPFNVSQDLNLTVAAPPVITGGATVTFTAGVPGSIAIDANNESVNQAVPTPTLSVKGSLPKGVTFKDNGNGTATLAGTPAAGSAGTYQFTINAHNSAGSAPPEAFVLTVDKFPVITSSASTTFVAGENGTFTIKASGLPIDAISIVGALPTGLALVDNHNGTATLSGTPTAGIGGVYHVEVVATNTTSNNSTSLGASSQPNTVVQGFTITVRAAPAFTSANNATFTVGDAGSFTVTTTGYPTAVLKSSTLPHGLTFTDNHNGTATIAGTPAAATNGTYNIILTANNLEATILQSFTLTIDS
jgi:hypothetical protein